MNCNNLHKRIIFYLENELPAWEMEEVKIHLERCPECDIFAEEIKKTLAVIDNEKISQKATPFFYTRVKARLENHEEEKTAISRNPLLVRILQPAFFSLLLLAGIYTGIKIGQPSKNTADTSTYAETEMIPYLNEMESETIENFLME